MTKANPRYPTFGSISSGTMRSEDLLPCLASELESILRDIPPADRNPDHVALLKECEHVTECPLPVDWESVKASEIVSDLFDALNEYAPPYGYFGANEGDGADYGFWLSEDALRDFDGLKVSDTSEIPADYSGEVLHINDHGNMTLYSAERGKLSEIWSIV